MAAAERSSIAFPPGLFSPSQTSVPAFAIRRRRPALAMFWALLLLPPAIGHADPDWSGFLTEPCRGNHVVARIRSVVAWKWTFIRRA